jgi:hypothetical protein
MSGCLNQNLQNFRIFRMSMTDFGDSAGNGWSPEFIPLTDRRWSPEFIPLLETE